MEPLKENEIYLVYQDCAMCGARVGWGKVQTEVANRSNFKIIEVPFTADGASEIIKAVCLYKTIKPKKKGSLATLPFFTDLKHFSKNLDDFVMREPATSPKKKTTKTAKTEIRESEEDGSDKESD